MNYLRTALITAALSLMIAATGEGQNRQHTVQEGETLFQIARQYDITVADLRAWNDLQEDELKVGQALLVRPPAEEAIVHTVEPQETLFSISKRYGVSIAALKRWNNLENNALKIGQELTVFPGDTTAANARIPMSENEPSRQNTYYTVKSGDNLTSIAREHNMNLEELKALNDLTSNTIRVGQRLTVRQPSAPPSVEESGNSSSPQGAFVRIRLENNPSLPELLERYEMDEEEFNLLNPDLAGEPLRSGQQVTMLAPPSRSYANPYRIDAGLSTLGSAQVSRYSESETGNTTTSGELYTPGELTAAHSNIALGTVVFVRNPQNSRGVFVRINDRTEGGGLKLSGSAWRALRFQAGNPTVNLFQQQ